MLLSIKNGLCIFTPMTAGKPGQKPQPTDRHQLRVAQVRGYLTRRRREMSSSERLAIPSMAGS